MTNYLVPLPSHFQHRYWPHKHSKSYLPIKNSKTTLSTEPFQWTERSYMSTLNVWLREWQGFLWTVS